MYADLSPAIPPHVRVAFEKFAEAREKDAYERGLRDGEARVTSGLKALSAFAPAPQPAISAVATPIMLSQPASGELEFTQNDGGDFDLDGLIREIAGEDDPRIRQLVLKLAFAAVVEAYKARGEDPAPVLDRLREMADAGGVEAATSGDEEMWLAWQRASTKTGGVKAVWDGTDGRQRKPLYGKTAESALRGQVKRGKRDEARTAKSDFERKVDSDELFSDEDWDDFAGHLENLSGREAADLRKKIKQRLEDAMTAKGIVKRGKTVAELREHMRNGVKKLIDHAITRKDLPAAGYDEGEGKVSSLIEQYGGIRPKDDEFERQFGMHPDKAVENGILPKSAVKRNGKRFTSLAEQMRSDGHFYVRGADDGSDGDQDAAFADAIREGRSSAEFDTGARAEDVLRRQSLSERLQLARLRRRDPEAYAAKMAEMRGESIRQGPAMATDEDGGEYPADWDNMGVPAESQAQEEPAPESNPEAADAQPATEEVTTEPEPAPEQPAAAETPTEKPADAGVKERAARIAKVKPGKSADIDGFTVTRGEFDPDIVTVVSPDGKRRVDTLDGAAAFIGRSAPAKPTPTEAESEAAPEQAADQDQPAQEPAEQPAPEGMPAEKPAWQKFLEKSDKKTARIEGQGGLKKELKRAAKVPPKDPDTPPAPAKPASQVPPAEPGPARGEQAKPAEQPPPQTPQPEPGPARGGYRTGEIEKVGGGVSRIPAYDAAGNEIGHVEYSVDGDRVEINDVKVASDHRRKGVATQLYEKLLAAHPEAKLASKLQTEDGAAFRQKFDTAHSDRVVKTATQPQTEPAPADGEETDEEFEARLKRELAERRAARGGKRPDEGRLNEILSKPRPGDPALSEGQKEQAERAAVTGESGGSAVDSMLGEASSRADEDPDGNDPTAKNRLQARATAKEQEDAMRRLKERDKEQVQQEESRARRMAVAADKYVSDVHSDIMGRLAAGRGVTVYGPDGKPVRLTPADRDRVRVGEDDAGGKTLQMKVKNGDWQDVPAETLERFAEALGIDPPNPDDPNLPDLPDQDIAADGTPLSEGAVKEATTPKGRAGRKTKASKTAGQPLPDRLSSEDKKAVNKAANNYRPGAKVPVPEVVRKKFADVPDLDDQWAAHVKSVYEAKRAERSERASKAPPKKG